MAGVNWKWILGIVGFFLKPILKAMTPNLEDELEKALVNLYKKALVTENPVDDLLMSFALEIFDIDVPE